MTFCGCNIPWAKRQIISDRGTGISPELQVRTMDPFYTATPVGEGVTFTAWLSMCLPAATGE
jgi:signal transduction histidine kinase